MKCERTFSGMHMFCKASDTNEQFAVQQEGRGPLAKSHEGWGSKHRIEIPKPILSQIPLSKG